MDTGERLQSHADTLTTYAFFWTLARLCISVVALLIGSPPALILFSFEPAYGFAWLFLRLSWIISGVAASYLLYRWLTAKGYVFDKATRKDTIALAVAIVSGLNLGFAGLFGTNIGLSFFTAYLFWLIGAGFYAWSAHHLFTRFRQSGNKLFL
jgi:hypothetical protein